MKIKSLTPITYESGIINLISQDISGRRLMELIESVTANGFEIVGTASGWGRNTHVIRTVDFMGATYFLAQLK